MWVFEYFAGSSNGRTIAFGVIYSGSSPGPAARHKLSSFVGNFVVYYPCPAADSTLEYPIKLFYGKSMSMKTFLTVNAVIAALFGIAFLVFPVQFLSGYGISLTPLVIILSRGLGGAILSIGIIDWFSRDVKDVKLLSGILLGNITVHLLTGTTDFMGYLDGTLNATFFYGFVIRGIMLISLIYYFIKIRSK